MFFCRPDNLAILRRLNNLENTLMAAIDDLNTVVAALGTSVSAYEAAVAAALAAHAGANDPAIAADAATLSTLKAQIDAATVALTPAPPHTP